MSRNNKKVFLDFVFTYFAIIILVLVCLFPIYLSLERAERDKATQRILNHGESNLRELEAEENRLFHTARNFYLDRELKQLYYRGSQESDAAVFYGMTQLQEKLKLYFQNVASVRDVIVYIPKYNYVLTQKYIFKDRMQFYEYNHSDAFSEKDWLNQLNLSENNDMIYAGNFTDLLNGGETYPAINRVFTFPMAGDSNVNIQIVILLDSQRIAEQFLSPEIRNQAFSIITDKEGNVMAESSPEKASGFYADNRNRRYQTITITSSPEKNITIYVDKQFYRTIRTKTLLLIANSIGAALLLSACVALYFARNRSRPLEHILDIIRKSNMAGEGATRLDDIEDNVIHMVSEIRRCEGTIKDLDAMVSHNLLERLFFGGLDSGKLEESFIQYFGCMPPSCVCSVFSREDNAVLDHAQKDCIINEFSTLESEVYASHIHNQKVYLLLCETPHIEEHITQVLKNLREQGEQIIKAGISNSITALSGVKEGALQAQRRLDAGFHIQGVYLFAHTYTSRSTRSLFNVQLFDALQRALVTGNKQIADKIIEELFQHIRPEKPDAVELRQIFFSLRSVYSMVINQFNLEAERSGERIHDCVHLPNDLDEYSPVSVENAFTILNNTIYEYYEKQLIRNKRIKGLDIITYIEENFRDPNLCASSISANFHLSEKYVFQLVKGAIGETLNDKISQLRVDAAIQLLEGTDKTVTEIAQKAGFTSSNSMYKVFMRVKGISPSAYRKQK